MQPHENVSPMLPKSPEMERLVVSAVMKLLETVPERWTEFSYDELTAIEQRAMFLLVAAGMVEQRMRFQISLLNRPGGFEAVIGATGERGFVEAINDLLPRLWDEWQKSWLKWEIGEQIGSSPFHCERLIPDHWRLTDQGVLAAGDLRQAETTDGVLDFVLRRNSFRRRPVAPGNGKLLSLQDLSGEEVAPKTVHVGNWKEGAKAFYSHVAQSLAAAADLGQQDDQPEETGQSECADGNPPAPSASGPLESVEPPELKPFSGGAMVYFPDRVELCGVVLFSGARSKRKRKALDLFRAKKNGRFVAYSGKNLAEKLGLETGPKGASGEVRDLRKGIRETLLKQANIECRDEDVILSGGPGYRFSEKLSVQYGNEADGARLQGHSMGHVDSNDPVDDPVTGSNDPVTEADDPVTDPVTDPVSDPVSDPVRDPVTVRRTWILHEIGKGRELRAPHIAEELHCSLPTAKRDLDALRAEGKIEFDGAPRSGHYRLCDESEDDETDRRALTP